jgi:hypothetical protein
MALLTVYVKLGTIIEAGTKRTVALPSTTLF